MTTYQQPRGLYASAASSRRRFMQSGGVAALVVAGTMTGMSAVAAQATLPKGLAEFKAGWETQDPARFAAAFTENGILEAVPMDLEITGREAIAADLAGLFDAFTDITTRMPTTLAVGDRAAAEWTFEGSYTGQLPGLPPGTGQRISFRGASALELEGDLVRRNSRYIDLITLLVQSGAVEPPNSAPAVDDSGNYDPNYDEVAATSRSIR